MPDVIIGTPSSPAADTGVAFLDRFYDEVNFYLGDPHSQKRLTKARKRALLFQVQRRIYTRLRNCSPQMSSIGWAEKTIAVVADQAAYALPGGYEEFISFQKFTNGDRESLEQEMGTVTDLDGRAGILLMDSESGFRIRPTPSSVEAGDWVLNYRKGPVKLHYATAESVTADTLVCATPATADAGELVLSDGYYDGVRVHIYSADDGFPQTRKINSCSVVGGKMELYPTVDFSPVPTGTILYEIMPDLPEGLDSIYAMDVAMLAASAREGIRRVAGLAKMRTELWSDCRNYYDTKTADRAPARLIPARIEPDPYE